MNGLKILIIAIGLNACLANGDKTKQINDLNMSNEIQRIAHMENNADLLASQIADTMISISKGSIRTNSNQEIRNKFEKYFTQVRYTSWDDTQEPIIRISEDGLTASVFVQKFLDLQYKDQNGAFGEHHYSLFAWNAQYMRVNNNWKMTANTSTERRLSEQEATDLSIHLSTEFATIPEVDLIPEGIAYDHTTGTTFLSSTYKQKIIAIRPDGSYYDFKKDQEDGLWSTVGMEVDKKRKRLWVVSVNANTVLPMKYPDSATEWKSRIYLYRLPDGALLETYEPTIDGQFVFNDLCIDSNGGAYITESLNNRVYYLNLSNNLFEKLSIQDSLFVFPNGITISDDNRFLYTATRNGILQYNLVAKTYGYLKKNDGIVDKRIDGLAYYKGTLIGNQPFLNRIVQFNLDEENQFIKDQRILEANNPYFDQPTTGEIADDNFIYLANAQMRSGFRSGVLKEKDSLNAIKLLKLKLYDRQ